MILYYHITKCESTTKAHPQETNTILSQDEWAFIFPYFFLTLPLSNNLHAEVRGFFLSRLHFRRAGSRPDFRRSV